jgi:hypothetical protein
MKMDFVCVSFPLTIRISVALIVSFVQNETIKRINGTPLTALHRLTRISQAAAHQLYEKLESLCCGKSGHRPNDGGLAIH